MKITVEQLRRIADGRTVYIWGAMIVGQGVCRSLERYDIPVSAFLDSSPGLQGSRALGHPVQAPSILDEWGGEPILVIVSSGHYDKEIEQLCQERGLKKNEGYILSRELNAIDPSIDIAGSCNLKCISCPRGNMEDSLPKGLMSLEDYRAVLDKLLAELPLLGSIQLYAWGEPFLHKKLPEIIAMNREAHLLTAISTNLNVPVDFERALSAQPDWIKVSASGFGTNYEITHTGGKWELFLKNMHRLAEARDKVHPGLQVVLNYHLYKHNCAEDYAKMRELCGDLGFIFRSNHAYLYPLDLVRDDLDGKPLPPEAEATKKLLLMPVEEGIETARAQKHLPCPEFSGLPITWNRQVRFCGVYYNPFLSGDFLTEPLEDMVKRRNTSEFCQECMELGLHQYTGVYLQEALPQESQP